MTNYSVDDYLGRTSPHPTDKPTSPTLSKSPSPLAQIGEFLAKTYQKSTPYQGVDLSQADAKDGFEHNDFRSQVGKLSQLLFGNSNPKTAKAYQLISHFDSQDRLSALTDGVYSQIARIAHAWAKKSLAKDARFAELATLSPSDRQAFAEDIANHNRMQVSLGGVAGFWGLKGVIADTAWLLLVSLKSIYQISYIYNQPLNDKDGSRLAFGILARCDLQKLQEKQVVATALAVGDGLLKNAQQTSVLDELKTLAELYSKPYHQTLDALGDFVDLDKFNNKWTHRLLGVVSAGAMVHYNNLLLEEVLGVAMATFGGDKSVPLLENNT